jgi:hypothetical protein
MFTLFWSPSESAHNVTFQPTLSLERKFGSSTHLFAEYVGNSTSNARRTSSTPAASGGSARLSSDFHVGVGLNRSSPTLNGVPVDQVFRHRLFDSARRAVQANCCNLALAAMIEVAAEAPRAGAAQKAQSLSLAILLRFQTTGRAPGVAGAIEIERERRPAALDLAGSLQDTGQARQGGVGPWPRVHQRDVFFSDEAARR